MSNTSTTFTVTPVNLVTTAETAVLSSTLNSENQPTGQGVSVNGNFNVTTGASTTGVTVRVRAGVGVAGALIGTAVTHTLAAAASATIPYGVLDATLVGTVQYTVTAQQVAASANGTVNQALMCLEPSTGTS